MNSGEGFKISYQDVCYLRMTLFFVDVTRDEVNNKLKRWMHKLESSGFRLSRSKIEYLKCSFSGRDDDDGGEVTTDAVAIPKVEKFKYLDSIIQQNGNIDEDISQRIKVG